ncbi:MAG: pyridoxamine kinase [Ruminococcaceae bacterium]|nr:pyridoxamine kinase [Oscillospiraceae bacterium]
MARNNCIPGKVAAIHDIAGFGRSSLTVVMPTLSVMGFQTCPAPTAVLSSITGFYTGYAMEDLTPFLSRCFAHWKKEHCEFDCIYTGFIGSAEGVSIAHHFIMETGAPLVVVDPVFADDGRCYDCFDHAMAKAMSELIRSADVITPNLTEACFLSGIPHAADFATAKRCLRHLAETVRGSVVITGVPCDDSVVVLLYDRSTDAAYQIENPYLHSHYPGTGDLFTSVLTGALLSGASLPHAAGKAADFVFTAIRTAQENGVPVREGVPMELIIPRLLEDHVLPARRL